MSASAPLNVITGLASMPLAFTENQGQWDEQVLFRANAGGATMWFTKSGAYYQFTRRLRMPGHFLEMRELLRTCIGINRDGSKEFQNRHNIRYASVKLTRRISYDC